MGAISSDFLGHDKLQLIRLVYQVYLYGFFSIAHVDILANNEGFLLCKWGESYGNGFSIFLRDPKIESSFSETGVLDFIQVGEGYEGEVFEGGIRIGSRIADIEHNLVLDDIEGAYYLADNEGRFINGIYFLVGGEQVIDNPNATILEVRVYDYSLM